MGSFTVIDDPSYEAWNKVLERATFGNYQQTFEFGEVMKRAIPRTRVVRLMAMENDKPVGVLQGFYRKRLTFGGELRVGGVSGGAPLTCVQNEMEKELVVLKLLEEMERHAVRNRVLKGRVYWTAKWGLSHVFHKLGYRIAGEVDAFIVDLRKPVEELWMSIDHNFRRKVRQAMKAGVEVVEAENQEDLLTFYEMVKAAGKRQGFNPQPFSEYKAIWDIFRSKGQAKFFLAKWKGKYVAGVEVIAHLKTLQATSAGSLKEGWKARPNDYLHWKIMEWASQEGFHFYNLGGALSPNLARWKKQFRARTEKIYKYEKVFLPTTEKIVGGTYKFLIKLRRKLK